MKKKKVEVWIRWRWGVWMIYSNFHHSRVDSGEEDRDVHHHRGLHLRKEAHYIPINERMNE